MDKKLIWIIGSMASGKSTQRKLLCEALAESERKVITKEVNGIPCIYTTFGKAIGMPGRANDNQCDGLDSVFGRMKKIGSLQATEEAIRRHTVTVLEGSQTTFFWTDPLIEMCEKHNCKFYLIHLNLSDELVIERLIQRNDKKGTEVTESKIKNVLGKNQQYYNIYEKLKVRDEITRKRIAAKKTPEQIFEQIIEFVFGED